MNLRMIIPMIVLLFLSLSCVAIDTAEEVRPQVSVKFNEDVLIFEYFLKGDLGSIIPMTMDPPKGSTSTSFVFTPEKSLSNDRYTLTVFAADLLNNTNKYTYQFDVFVPGTVITLVEPNEYGVANTTTFRVKVLTSKPAVCKYTGIPVSSFDDVRLKYFDVTGNLSAGTFADEHSINSYSVDEGFVRPFFVVCKDELGREVYEVFSIVADTTPPTLESVVFKPSPILEYPPGGGIYSMLTVDASEPVICRYTQDVNASYAMMTPFTDSFDGFSAFSDYHDEKIYFPPGVIKDRFVFYVQCEDLAGWKSVRMERPIDIDLSAGLKISVVSPPAMSKSTSVFLNVSTNRNAYCLYKVANPSPGEPADFTDISASMSSSYLSLSRVHTADMGTKPVGEHSVSIRCEVPEGVALEPLKAEITHNFIIDQTPPSTPVVNATSPVCGNTFSATFTANDTHSGISAYMWAVGSAGAIMANGTTSDDSVSVSKSNNGTVFVLSPASIYAFSVMAVDGAGNIGPAGVSNTITYDETGVGCDDVPPIVTLERSSTGDSVNLRCTDDRSGCNSVGSYYGTSYDQDCNATQYFLDPVVIPLFKTTVICWDVKDNANNVARGSDTVTLNATDLGLNMTGGPCPGGIDSDGDGYGERCLLGPDCNDQDGSLNVACINGCIQDLDGDGYGPGCALGADCNGRDPNLTVVCPNDCISDGDGDEFGLGCINGPDCKGDDSTLTVNCPNGCVDDNDGDSYGLQCPAGFDCNGEDSLKISGCDNSCLQDTDGDSFGVYCMLGMDCDGRYPYTNLSCDNGCSFDEDGDGFGQGCLKGLDCDGMHPLQWAECPNNCLSDDDGDGYGWGCDNGADCNDTDPYVNLDCSATSNCVYDHDGDGFGLGCALGFDCDEYDATVTQECSGNCTYDEDCDSLPDYWQEKYFNMTTCNDTAYCGPDADPDGDGFSNVEEYRRNSDPLTKEEVYVPPEVVSGEVDEDGDGVPDACEKRYGLNPQDPYDGDKDPDNDGLTNREECLHTSGMCVNGMNPQSEDTDNDGYTDPEELEAGTDPCDPESMPSAGMLPLLLIILGLLSNTGSIGYLIYKRYYIPLVSPPPKPAVAPAAAHAAARRAGVPPPGAVHHHVRPLRLPPKVPAGPATSKDLFDKELARRAEEREKILGVFGERKHVETKPRKVMEELARRPAEVRRVRAAVPHEARPQARAAAAARPPAPDYVSKLTKVVGEDYFDKISDLTKQEADYMGKLATITKEKKVALEEDHVSKLARITKKVADDKTQQKELETAFKRSDMDRLDSFLASKKKVGTFIKETVSEKPGEAKAPEPDSFEALASVTGGTDQAGFDALSELSKRKRSDIVQELAEMGGKKAEKALSEVDRLSGVESKEELFRVVEQMSRGKHVDKNVFEVILSYLMKSGKISRQDVSELLFSLEKQGVLSKKDIAEVFFNLGIKK